MPDAFAWLNPPSRFRLGDGLEILTDKETDFWQRTHYGFCRDNGHCLLARVSGDFSLQTRVQFRARQKYDQCGLMLRLDTENWIKVSTEFETNECSRLGSVVTNFGYSDWATQDISSRHNDMWYRASKLGSDYRLEHSYDGSAWQQLRIAHLHHPCESIQAGVYACSPTGQDFWCRFHFLTIDSAVQS